MFRTAGGRAAAGSYAESSSATSWATVSRRLRLIANAVVKGKTLPMKIYEPLTPAMVARGYARRYAAAYAALEAGSPGTPALFEALALDDPEDGVVAFHLERLRRGIIEQEVVLQEK